MKKYGFLLVLILSCSGTFAQFGGIGQKLKEKAKQAVDRQTDKTLDKIVGKGENKVDETVDGALDGGKKKTKQKEGDGVDVSTAAGVKRTGSIFSMSSKFDFIPGEKIVATEDFLQDAKGDFPAKWNFVPETHLCSENPPAAL